MRERPPYDVVVLGGGSAGLAALEGARAAGAKRLCLVAEGDLGGECPWSACVPTKTLLRSARYYDALRHDMGRFGIHVDNVRFDFGTVMRRKNAVIAKITGNGKRVAERLQRDGVTVVRARAAFIDEHHLVAGNVHVQGKSIVIATGSVAALPPIPGLTDVPYLTYDTLLRMPTLPKSIAIIGAGPVGVEFATFCSAFGVRTALFTRESHILEREDEELALMAEEQLAHKGVHVGTNATVLSVKRVKAGIQVTVQEGEAERRSFVVEKLLVAAGRRPNTSTLDLQEAGAATDPRGYVQIDNKGRTTARHIFVAGDASGHHQFTHTAHYSGFTAGWNAMCAKSPKKMRTLDFSIVPRVTFTAPELASVGMTVSEAKKAGEKMTVKKVPLAALGRAVIDGTTTGMLKVIVAKDDDRILGAHMYGERAGEVIHEIALAMRVGLPFTELQSTMHAFPTYSELISLAR